MKGYLKMKDVKRLITTFKFFFIYYHLFHLQVYYSLLLIMWLFYVSFVKKIEMSFNSFLSHKDYLHFHLHFSTKNHLLCLLLALLLMKIHCHLYYTFLQLHHYVSLLLLVTVNFFWSSPSWFYIRPAYTSITISKYYF